MKAVIRILGLALALSVAACSAPSSPAAPGGDAGDGDVTNGDAGSGGGLVLFDGVYEGTAAGDAGTRDATMALWPAESGWQGRVVLDGAQAFTVELDDTRTMMAVDGACQGCDVDARWQLDVQSSGGEVRLAVVSEDDVPSPGFDDLVMVPHDGFKPERATAPEVASWTGPVVAVEAAMPDSPVFDADCELIVRLDDDHVESLICKNVDAGSPWLSVVADSFSADDEFSFVVEAGSVRIGYIGGLQQDADGRVARGTVHRLGPDDLPDRALPTIGSFSLETFEVK